MKILAYTSRLAQTTQGLLRQRPRELTLAKIAADTPLSLSWLQYFVATPQVDAAASRIEILYEYLTQKPLALVEPPAARD